MNENNNNKSVFNKDTFLTSLREASDETLVDLRKKKIQDPPSMGIARQRYVELKSLVGNLSQQIGVVLEKQESDFMAAYRAHMYNVQKELHETKQKMLEAETEDKKNDRVKSLEEERNWYRKEALRLDGFANNMSQDLKMMKEKLGNIEEDRNWLEKQLKASKKQNKLLRAELEIRITDQTEPKSTSRFQARNVEEEDEESSSEPTIDPKVMEIMEQCEEMYKKQIKTLKKQLNTKKKELGTIRSNILTGQHHSTELEEFFLQCVDSVKKDISRRKQKLINKRNDQDQLSIVPNVDLKDFTSSDRVHVVEKLIGRDEVLGLIYDQMFPSTSSNKLKSPQKIISTTSSSLLPSQLLEKNSSSVSVAPTLSLSSPRNHRNNEQHHSNDVSLNQKSSSVVVGSGKAAVSASREGIALDQSTLEFLQESRRPVSSLM